MASQSYDLTAAARSEMIHEGFHPDFPPGSDAQIEQARKNVQANSPAKDLRGLLWSSIDNDTSRDLDQIEYAERNGDHVRVLVGIADVDIAVPLDSPLDQHAESETTSVYTGVKTFPMLPEALSTDLTSLNPDGDRQAMVIEFSVDSEGDVACAGIYRALVRNQAQLTYSGVGGWLEGGQAPPAVTQSQELQAQLRLQDEVAQLLRKRRYQMGALDFDRSESQPVLSDGTVKDVEIVRKNRASSLIEDFMVAANECMAKTLQDAKVSSIRRVVRTPERWPRIVELAAARGTQLPAEPDPKALNAFLEQQKQHDPDHYPDLSLAVIKLMGPGEYVLARAGSTVDGHFGLAAHDYTHSTAPNRRFADLVTQRLIKAMIDRKPNPYSDDRLESIARNCTLKEDAARKVERTMEKRIAAVALSHRVGESFNAVVTGVTPKGTFVRVPNPPVEGRVLQGEQGLDVGDRVRVKLTGTDPARGYIDFAR